MHHRQRVGALALLAFFALACLTVSALPLGGRTEVLTGESARAYVAGKERARAHFKAARREAFEDLRRRGFVQTHEVLVYRFKQHTSGLARLQELVLPSLHAEEYYDNGVIVLESWDDDDHSTWEGYVYVEDSQGNWSSSDTQWDISVTADINSYEPPTVLWVGAAQDNGDECRTRESCELPNNSPGHRVLDFLLPRLLAQASDNLSCGAGAHATTRAFMKQGMQRAADNAWYILSTSALAGFLGGAPAFIGSGGVQVWGLVLDGYMSEFRRYYSRC